MDSDVKSLPDELRVTFGFFLLLTIYIHPFSKRTIMPNTNKLNYRELKSTHICGNKCLGPLTFHQETKGSSVTLSLAARCAERAGDTFRDGLVFSNRPVRVGERLHLRVECTAQHWHGALRIGFTSVCPKSRTLPMFAIPDLTDTPGHWACPVPVSDALPGSELQFWVTWTGHVRIKVDGCSARTVLGGVDVAGPLWAMLDVYGQTCAVLLLGSKKKTFFGMKKSCPLPPPPPVSVKDSCLCAYENYLCKHKKKRMEQNSILLERKEKEHLEDCSVCMNEKTNIILSCGHQCLCFQCADRVFTDFGTCPLCREPITNFRPRNFLPI